MARVILLLPGPDRLQLANCHKYVTRGGQRAYSEIYTFSTIAGKCAVGVDKLLIIGHGSVGGVQGATSKEVAQAIVRSKLPLVAGSKVAFDTCWGGASDDELSSVITRVGSWLKGMQFDAHVRLTGATGCTVTTGGDKRLVILNNRLNDASDEQNHLLGQHQIVGMNAVRPDWVETASSSQIKLWAKEEFERHKDFAKDLRTRLAADHMLDDTSGRKTSVQI